MKGYKELLTTASIKNKQTKNFKDQAEKNRKIILKLFPLTDHVITVKNSYLQFYIRHILHTLLY